jgi:predicted ATPase
MYIERIQVEEGFLDGLDLKLIPGLNVLIGARGTGKTSLDRLRKRARSRLPVADLSRHPWA